VYIKNVYFSTAYRMMTAIFLFYGILCHLSFTNPDITAHNISFFTVQSNIFCFLCFYILITQTLRGSKSTLTETKYAATLCIIVTFLCFHYAVVSAKTYNGGVLNLTMANFIAHYVAPTLVCLDWLLFTPKGRICWYSPVLWILAPMSYFFLIIIRALCHPPEAFASTGKYPYFFLNIDIVGTRVYIYVIAYLLFFLLLGYIFYAVDKLLYYCSKVHLPKYKSAESMVTPTSPLT